MKRLGQTGHRHSAEARARIGEGVRRGRKAWLRGLALQPKHLKRFVATHHVAPSMRALLSEAMRETGELAQQLGNAGANPAQRALLRMYSMHATAAMAAHEGLLGSEKPNPRWLELLNTHASACSRILGALGLTAADANGEDEALVAYQRALAQRRKGSDRGPGTGCMTPAPTPGGSGAPRSAVNGSAPGVSRGEDQQPGPAAPRAPGPTGGQR